MQAILEILNGSAFLDPFERAKERLADKHMEFENSIFKFTRNCIKGELEAINKMLPNHNFQLICGGNYGDSYIKCLPFTIINDRVTKLGADSIDMYLDSLREFNQRTPAEDNQLKVLIRLRSLLTFSDHVAHKYGITIC